MIDSGYKWAEGAVQFEQVYKRHIDDALARQDVIAAQRLVQAAIFWVFVRHLAALQAFG
mgnify:CR=1 FL=1